MANLDITLLTCSIHIYLHVGWWVHTPLRSGWWMYCCPDGPPSSTDAINRYGRCACVIQGMTVLELLCANVASYPGSQWAAKERAWYPLFVHALNFPEILGNRKLLCYIRIIVTTWRILTATLSAHFLTNDESVSTARSPGLSSSLQQLGTSDMSLKKV